MIQVEVNENLKWRDLISKVKRHDVILTRRGSPVARVSKCNKDDLDKEQKAVLKSSIQERVRRGELITHEQLKKELGINESFEEFLWKEVNRLLAQGSNSEEPFDRLSRLFLKSVDQKSRPRLARALTRSNCRIRFDPLAPSRLGQLVFSKDAILGPMPSPDADNPIIVVQYARKKYVIYGSRQLDLWRAEKRQDRLDAIIIDFKTKG